MSELIPEYSFIKVVETLTDAVRYIYFTNKKTDNKILTHFELSTNNPCILPDEHNWISRNAKEIEKSCNCKSYINGLLYDPEFREVGNNILMKSLYYDNSISVFSDYNNNEMVNLYARNYYYLNKTCSEKFLYDFEQLEKYYYSRILILRILQYILFGFFVLYMVFVFVKINLVVLLHQL